MRHAISHPARDALMVGDREARQTSGARPSPDDFAAKTFVRNGKTDVQGRGHVAFDGPGIYVLEAQRSWLLGDSIDAKTHLYSLTLEVTP